MSSSDSSELDSVVVGASLVGMFEALSLARQGRRVAILEQSSQVGGSWRTMRTRHCEDLNLGTHFFRNYPRVQRFVLGNSGTEFVPLTPAPKVHYRGATALEDSSLHHLMAVAHKAEQLAKLGFGDSPRKRQDAARYARAIVRSPLTIGNALRRRSVFYYPKHGLSDLLARMREQLERVGVELRLETRVEGVDIAADRSGVRARTTRGAIAARELIVFSNTVIPASDSFRLDPVQPIEPMRYPHLSLLIEGDVERRFSHLNFIGDELAVRINDYTGLVTLKPAFRDRGLKILHGWVHDVPFGRAEQAGRIVEQLKRLGDLGPNARLADWEFFDHVIQLNNEANIHHIHRHAAPAVRIIPSYSIVEGLLEVARRWR